MRTMASIGSPRTLSVLSCESSDRGPVERLAALRHKPQESIAQDARKGHRDLELLARAERQADILESERRRKCRGLEVLRCDQIAVCFVRGRREERRGEELDVGA